MSDEVFGATYAAAYDLFYADKDYAAECDAIEEMFSRHSRRPIHRVLDLGCGTGRHSCLLSARGYHVVGVDRSVEMLRTARARARQDGVNTQFVVGDIRTASVEGKFDAALMMFAVLGYQTSDVDFRAALNNARQHLSPGGVLIFDVWYAPAVLAQAPEPRWRFYETAPAGIVRYSRGSLVPGGSVCTVDIELWSVTPGNAEVAYTSERHEMRYFSRDELRQELRAAGCELSALVAFPETEKAPDTSTWNVLAVAVAV